MRQFGKSTAIYRCTYWNFNIYMYFTYFTDLFHSVPNFYPSLKCQNIAVSWAVYFPLLYKVPKTPRTNQRLNPETLFG